MKKAMGFDEKDPVCRVCSGYGNQLFMCHYCENYDHFERVEEEVNKKRRPKNHMKKINARAKPAEKKETSKLLTKTFQCEMCSCVEYVKSVEFGEDVRCPECGAKMHELIKNNLK